MVVKHKDVGEKLTYTEYHADDAHTFEAQTVGPSHLSSVDSPADGEVATYNESEGKFEWKSAGGPSVLVVAAADTPTIFKNRADYVCTGTSTAGGDQTTINTALGLQDVVLLCVGTFWVSGSIVLAAGKSLIGSGNSTIVKIRNSHNASINAISATSVADVLISNLVVDGNRTNQASGNMRGIYFNGVTYSTIKNCTIESIRVATYDNGAGIGFIDADYNKILHCLFTDNLRTNFAVFTSDHNIFAHNQSDVTDYDSADSVVWDTSNYNEISSNQFDNSSASNNYVNALTVENTSTYNRISNNLVKAGTTTESNGLYIRSASYNTIKGNICVGATEGFGIWIRGADEVLAYESEYNNVIGNIFCTDKYGIYIDSQYGDTDNNLIANNVCDSNVQHGIAVIASVSYHSDYNTIVGNKCTNNQRHGILIQTSSHNVITNNHIYRNGQQTDDTYDGINLDNDSNYNNLQCNLVRHGGGAKQQKYGINIVNSNCDGNMVTNNDLYNAGKTANLIDSGTATVTIAGNRT